MAKPTMDPLAFLRKTIEEGDSTEAALRSPSCATTTKAADVRTPVRIKLDMR